MDCNCCLEYCGRKEECELADKLKELAEYRTAEEQRNKGCEKQISDWTLQEVRDYCRSHNCNNEDNESCKLFGTLCRNYSFGIPSGFALEAAERKLKEG